MAGVHFQNCQCSLKREVFMRNEVKELIYSQCPQVRVDRKMIEKSC